MLCVTVTDVDECSESSSVLCTALSPQWTRLCALLLLCLCPWCWLGGRINSLDSSLMLLFQQKLNSTRKLCFCWSPAPDWTLKTLLLLFLNISVTIKKTTKSKSFRISVEAHQHRPLQLDTHIVWFLICCSVGVYLRHFLPLFFSFSLWLDDLCLWWTADLYKSKASTSHDLREQMTSSGVTPTCLHVSSSEWCLVLSHIHQH